jgi:hypothetical protein
MSFNKKLCQLGRYIKLYAEFVIKEWQAIALQQKIHGFYLARCAFVKECFNIVKVSEG